MEELILKQIRSEINRFDDILKMDDTDNLTLKSYKQNYKIIKDYLENFLIDMQKIINNPVVRKKYNEEENK